MSCITHSFRGCTAKKLSTNYLYRISYFPLDGIGISAVNHTNYSSNYSKFNDLRQFCYSSSYKSISTLLSISNISTNYASTPLITIRFFSTTKTKSSKNTKGESGNNAKKSVSKSGKSPNSQQHSQPILSNTTPEGVVDDITLKHGSNKASLGKPCKPVVPIFYYEATKRATDSINHRLFYINALFVIFLYDIATGLIDY